MSQKLMITLSLIAAVSSLPLDSDAGRDLSINDFFTQLNQELKREIVQGLKNETNVEIGDKFKDDDGKVLISVQAFSFGTDAFPVTFEKSDKDDNLADDKEITPIKGDFDDASAIYKIENEDSDEVTAKVHEETTAKPQTTTKESEKKPTTSETKMPTKTEQKLLKEVAQQPILTTV